jgi:hypothetical protein
MESANPDLLFMSWASGTRSWFMMEQGSTSHRMSMRGDEKNMKNAPRHRERWQ